MFVYTEGMCYSQEWLCINMLMDIWQVMANSAEKVRLAGNQNVMVCERGTMFGYSKLICKLLIICRTASFCIRLLRFDLFRSVNGYLDLLNNNKTCNFRAEKTSMGLWHTTWLQTCLTPKYIIINVALYFWNTYMFYGL